MIQRRLRRGHLSKITRQTKNMIHNFISISVLYPIISVVANNMARDAVTNAKNAVCQILDFTKFFNRVLPRIAYKNVGIINPSVASTAPSHSLSWYPRKVTVASIGPGANKPNAIVSNIVFSGILKSDGKIGDLLINSGNRFKFISPDFLRLEIRQHHDKLMKISKLTLEQVLESEYQICKSINFISEEQISPFNWEFAENLVFDVDKKETKYTWHWSCLLYTSDAADERSSVDLGGRRIIKKKKKD